jgi:hypothetical protein
MRTPRSTQSKGHQHDLSERAMDHALACGDTGMSGICFCIGAAAWSTAGGVIENDGCQQVFA